MVHTCLDIDISIKMLSVVSRTGGVMAFRRGICNIYTCVYIYVYLCVCMYTCVYIYVYMYRYRYTEKDYFSEVVESWPFGEVCVIVVCVCKYLIYHM